MILFSTACVNILPALSYLSAEQKLRIQASTDFSFLLESNLLGKSSYKSSSHSVEERNASTHHWQVSSYPCWNHGDQYYWQQ